MSPVPSQRKAEAQKQPTAETLPKTSATQAPGSSRSGRDPAQSLPAPLLQIARGLERIISKYSPPGQLRLALLDLLELPKAAQKTKSLREKTRAYP
jgi:hypothetical protein